MTRDDAKAIAELAVLLARSRPDLNVTSCALDALEMMRLAKRLGSIAEAECNRMLTSRDHVARRKIHRRMHWLAEVWRVAPTFDNDPRGYAVKLHFPPERFDGRKPCNTWGGEESGWGIG